MLEKEEIEEKLEKGWIKAVMWFEVMASEKELAESTLEDHIKSMQNLKNAYILNQKFEEVKEVIPPPKKVEKAFSRVAHLELLAKNLETLLFAVIYFAPSSVEILAPKKLTIGIETMQSIMNSVADVMHKFAAAGAGGVIVSTRNRL